MSQTFAVFGVAHQDDELVQFGSALKSHLDYGRPCAVVCFTEGGATGIRTGSLATKLGYVPTRAAVTFARTAEFLEALQAFGVPRENIHMVGEPDAGLTVKRAKEIWRYYIDKYPNGSYKAHSWIDANRDHNSIGMALDELNQEGVAPDARFYMNRQYIEQMPFAIPRLGKELSKPIPPEAYQAYKTWQPHIERWGCGYLSAGSLIEWHRGEPYALRHMPSSDAKWTPTLLQQSYDWVESKGGYYWA